MIVVPTANAAYFVDLIRYTAWANARMVTALRDVDPETTVPDTARELLSHLLRSQAVWLRRVQSDAPDAVDFWATDDLDTCEERVVEQTRAWTEMLEACTPGDLDAPVTYQNSKGETFETPLRAITTHVINHATHHRAQIAMLLRQAGGTPPATDYIVYVRKGAPVATPLDDA